MGTQRGFGAEMSSRCEQRGEEFLQREEYVQRPGEIGVFGEIVQSSVCLEHGSQAVGGGEIQPPGKGGRVSS